MPAPTVSSALGSLDVPVGARRTITLSDHFDAGDDAIVYALENTDDRIATAAVDDGGLDGAQRLVIVGVAEGATAVRVIASVSGYPSAQSTLSVTVPPPNRAPVATEILEQVVAIGETVEVDLADYFSDPDGDALTYAASSAAGAVATVSISGSVITITGVAAGGTSINTTAEDPAGLSANLSVPVTVPGTPPTLSDTSPSRVNLVVGRSETVDVSAFFRDNTPPSNLIYSTALGDDIASAVLSGSRGGVTITGESAGVTSIRVTARDPTADGTVSVDIQVNVKDEIPEAIVPGPGPQAPTLDQEFDPLTLRVGGNAAQYILDAYFSGQHALEYIVSVGQEAVATATETGDSLTVTPVGEGTTNVSITARDTVNRLTVQTSFAVAVLGNQPPRALNIPILEVIVEQGETHDFGDVAQYFEDPESDPLSYGVSTEDATVATGSLMAADLTIAGVGPGGINLTITATDADNRSATIDIPVTVPGMPPTRTDATPSPVEVAVGQSKTVNIAGFFRDNTPPSNLIYSVRDNDPAGADFLSVVLSGARAITITGEAIGSSSVTVTARDPTADPSVSVNIPVMVVAAPTVGGNRPPTLDNEFAAVDLIVGGRGPMYIFDAYFSDPDGDDLSFIVRSGNEAVASVTYEAGDDSFQINPVGRGSTFVTVTCRDPSLLQVSTAIQVTVRPENTAPRVTGAIVEKIIGVGQTIDVQELGSYFTDDEGDTLTHTVVSDDTAVATATLRDSGQTARIVGGAVGSATITVTGTDPSGLAADPPLTFTVTVVATTTNEAPEVGDAFDDLSIQRGQQATVDLAGHFTDPDNDALAYIATTSNSDQVRARVNTAGTQITLSAHAVTRVATPAVITVTATDPEGLTASQSFEVDVLAPPVENQPPEYISNPGFADIRVAIGETKRVSVPEHFMDEDDTVLTYAVAEDSSQLTARAHLVGTHVHVTGVANGTATVTVTCSDPAGDDAQGTFQVTVSDVSVDPNTQRFNLGPPTTVTARFIEWQLDPSIAVIAGLVPAGASRWLGYFSIRGSAIGLNKAAMGLAATAEGSDVGPTEDDLAAAFESGGGCGLEYGTDEIFFRPPNWPGIPVQDDSEFYHWTPGPDDQFHDPIEYYNDNPTEGGVLILSTEPLDPDEEPEDEPPTCTQIPDQRIQPGGSVEIDLSTYFADPEGLAIRYLVVIADGQLATARVSGSSLTLTGVSVGGTTVTVTGRDPADQAAACSFRLVVSTDLIIRARGVTQVTGHAQLVNRGSVTIRARGITHVTGQACLIVENIGERRIHAEGVTRVTGTARLVVKNPTLLEMETPGLAPVAKARNKRTVQGIIDAAYARAKRAQQGVDANEPTELRLQLLEVLETYWQAGVRINPYLFSDRRDVDWDEGQPGELGGWRRPDDAEAILHVFDVQTERPVFIVPQDDLNAEGGNGIYLDGPAYRAIPGGWPEPDTPLCFVYCSLPVDLPNLLSKIDDRWPRGHERVLAIELALYIAMKDERSENEIRHLEAQRDRQAQRFAMHVEHINYGETRRKGHRRRFSSGPLTSVITGDG